MSASRLWLLILCGLALQQLLPVLSSTDEGGATTSAAWQEAPALGALHGNPSQLEVAATPAR
jgi:hypothetical protein